jgi:hypothetical protein
VPGVDLGPHHEAGGPRHVGTRPVDRPRRAVQAVGHRNLHQLVVGGVVGDLVDAMPVTVVGAQLGRVAVGVEPPLDRLGRPGQAAERMQVVDGPAGALALDGLHQGGVGSEHVVALERRRLVRDLVGGAGHGTHGACL